MQKVTNHAMVMTGSFHVNWLQLGLAAIIRGGFWAELQQICPATLTKKPKQWLEAESSHADGGLRTLCSNTRLEDSGKGQKLVF
jgi:hypothetical protein